MTLPPLPTPPHVDLPPQFVIPLEALASFWALANIALGFLYLLCGIKVFRVMTTITAVLWGMALGVFLGSFIESVTVGMIVCSAALGLATWFYTRWMIALPVGLGAATLAWTIATLNGANHLSAFLISLAAAVALGGPVLMFYRTVVMAVTCVQGAFFVVIGTATAILLIRHVPLNSVQNDIHPNGHILLGLVCVLILAIPSFYFQRSRYPQISADGNLAESDSGKETSFKKKAA